MEALLDHPGHNLRACCDRPMQRRWDGSSCTRPVSIARRTSAARKSGGIGSNHPSCYSLFIVEIEAYARSAQLGRFLGRHDLTAPGGPPRARRSASVQFDLRHGREVRFDHFQEALPKSKMARVYNLHSTRGPLQRIHYSIQVHYSVSTTAIRLLGASPHRAAGYA